MMRAGKARSNQALYENIGEDMSLLWACLGEHMNGSGSAKVTGEAASGCCAPSSHGPALALPSSSRSCLHAHARWLRRRRAATST